jgi:outer membrane protease
MRRTALAAASLWLSFTASSVAAQEIGLASGLDGYDESYSWENETLSFGVSGGWLTGQSHEFVYDGSGNKISELIWDMNHAYALNSDLGIRLTPELKLNASGTWGGDIDSHMEDYDWLGLDYGQTDWTHRSIHEDTKLDHFARFDLNLQYDFIRRPAVVVGALLGGRFTGVQWKAHGGDFVYTTDPSTTFRDDVFSLSDDILGITYEQSWAVAYAGLSAAVKTDSWRIAGTVVGSPLAFGSSDDDHWLRSLHFEDEFDRSSFVGASAEIAYLFNGHYQVFVSANGERFFHTYGDTTIKDTSTGGQANLDGDVSGGDHENLQVSVGFRVTN